MKKIHLAQQAKKQLTACVLGRKSSVSKPHATLPAFRNAARQSFTGLHPLRPPPDRYRDYIEMLVTKAARLRFFPSSAHSQAQVESSIQILKELKP